MYILPLIIDMYSQRTLLIPNTNETCLYAYLQRSLGKLNTPLMFAPSLFIALRSRIDFERETFKLTSTRKRRGRKGRGGGCLILIIPKIVTYRHTDPSKKSITFIKIFSLLGKLSKKNVMWKPSPLRKCKFFSKQNKMLVTLIK